MNVVQKDRAEKQITLLFEGETVVIIWLNFYDFWKAGTKGDFFIKGLRSDQINYKETVFVKEILLRNELSIIVLAFILEL